MTKDKCYKAMVDKRKLDSREKTLYAIRTIKEMVTREEPVGPTRLSEKTGLSRSFFYNNAEVRGTMERAVQKQGGIDFGRRKRQILNKELQRRVETQDKQIREMHDHITDLEEQLREYRRIIDDYHLEEYRKINPYG